MIIMGMSFGGSNGENDIFEANSNEFIVVIRELDTVVGRYFIMI